MRKQQEKNGSGNSRRRRALPARTAAEGTFPGNTAVGDTSWKVYALAFATTGAAAYILCAFFDALFPPFGLLAWLAPASPWPITGGPLGYAFGLALSAAAGFVLGAIYAGAWRFWRRRLG
ncbi:hypothetical protein [Pelomicrobium sp. G1]|jgi:hypothetical protein|uniref:hypothetical protein n=1 Tax=unclassified Pelomicrobium TaxID=2815318 RepID=UPI003488EEFF